MGDSNSALSICPYVCPASDVTGPCSTLLIGTKSCVYHRDHNLRYLNINPVPAIVLIRYFALSLVATHVYALQRVA